MDGESILHFARVFLGSHGYYGTFSSNSSSSFRRPFPIRSIDMTVRYKGVNYVFLILKFKLFSSRAFMIEESYHEKNLDDKSRKGTK